jgi:hypothetical protein
MVLDLALDWDSECDALRGAFVTRRSRAQQLSSRREADALRRPVNYCPF